MEQSERVQRLQGYVRSLVVPISSEVNRQMLIGAIPVDIALTLLHEMAHLDYAGGKEDR